MISWYAKLGIGAIGAFCLSLLKLINANFYLGVTDHAVALGAYLTYGAYVVLGMAVGYFFCEDTPESQKTRKSAFLMGLLAPSILIAIVTKPITGQAVDSGQPSAVPALSIGIQDLLGVTVYAQTAPEKSAAPSVPIEMLRTSGSASGIAAGVRSALGIQDISPDYLYIVGKTDDATIAKRKAGEINTWLQKTNGNSGVRAHIFKAEWSDQLYLAIGSASSAKDVTETKKLATDSAAKALTSQATAQDKSAAQVLLQGQIIRRDALTTPDGSGAASTLSRTPRPVQAVTPAPDPRR